MSAVKALAFASGFDPLGNTAISAAPKKGDLKPLTSGELPKTGWRFRGQKSTKKSFRRAKYKNSRVAGDILKNHHHSWRTTYCHRRVADGKGGVSVEYVKSSKSGVFNGLQTCGSVHLCAVCAGKIMAQRSDTIREIVENSGATLIMVTLTIQHKRTDRLESLLSDLKIASRYQEQGKGKRLFNEQFGIIGQIKSLETRYGKNGWHPHQHILLLSNKSKRQLRDSTRAIKTQYMSRYGKKLESMGYLVNHATIDVRIEHSNDNKTLEDYLTKSSIELELTQNESKKSASVSPFQIVSEYQRTGNEMFASLWIEYAEATYGKRQMTFSKGLVKEFTGDDEKSDETIASELPEDRKVLAVLTVKGWRFVESNNLRVDLLEVADSGDKSKVLAWLKARDIETMIRIEPKQKGVAIISKTRIKKVKAETSAQVKSMYLAHKE